VNLADLTDAARALASRLVDANDGRRDVTIETIDGVPAGGSPYAGAFEAAGFRASSNGLRYYAPPR
jgi:predicted Zn-dependent protease